MTRVKRLIFGRPLASDRLEQERLNKKTALAVLSSDAISSVAYATEQILLVLAVLGAVALNYVVPISAVIVGLLVLVALSYRQTVFAYPEGGGSTPSRKTTWVRCQGSSPLPRSSPITYSRSQYQSLQESRRLRRLSRVSGARSDPVYRRDLLLTLVNLRGVRDSGIVFSVPTYVFIALMLALLITGFFQDSSVTLRLRLLDLYVRTLCPCRSMPEPLPSDLPSFS